MSGSAVAPAASRPFEVWSRCWQGPERRPCVRPVQCLHRGFGVRDLEHCEADFHLVVHSVSIDRHDCGLKTQIVDQAASPGRSGIWLARLSLPAQPRVAAPSASRRPARFPSPRRIEPAMLNSISSVSTGQASRSVARRRQIPMRQNRLNFVAEARARPSPTPLWPRFGYGPLRRESSLLS